MKIPVFAKILAGYAAVTALLSVFVLASTFRIVKEYHLNTLAANLNKIAISASADISGFVARGRTDSLDAHVKDLGSAIRTRITVVDTSGAVLADSENDPARMENHKAREEITEALNGRVGRSLRFSRTVKEEMLYMAIPIRNEDGIAAVLRVSLFASEINELLRSLQIRVVSAAFLIIAISLGLAIIFSRNISKPIRRLVNASRRIAEGDFDVNIILKNRDEFKELADSYNHMVSQLKKSVSELGDEKETLNTIVNSIQEAIVVMDRAGRVVLHNRRFQEIAGTGSINGRFYWEVLRSANVGALIQAVREKGIAQSEEFELRGRHYLGSAAVMSAREEIVLTLHDITEIMRLATVKKDFVVNVSHELRTPLTAIKGFLETMEQDSSQDAGHYLEIVRRHTDRLINIVRDLQQLSELEAVERLQTEKVNIALLLRPVVKMFEPKLADKGLKIELKVADIEIVVDPFKFEQVCINLIDNAIKYTERGRIMVSAEQDARQTWIAVEDTGIGIPKEQLPRIFERFYVVDKSHSRRMGGTGLGLSIVKHIVLAHRGTVSIESVPGKGTKVIITLPRTTD